MSDAPTLTMEELDRQQARALSLLGLRPPLRVAGYEQLRFVGKGTFGEVWRAVDSNNGRQVAIKFYNRRGGLDWALLSREVENLRHLFSDRHVVQLFAVGWDADPPYYVMEYMEHGSLEDRLRQGPLPLAEALEIFREVAVGLLHAHGKGILHCDLKPGNVLLDQDLRPRLADFGQARLTHEALPSLGTLFYMAPEQADLQAMPDARWDVYALGALLYCMLTGEPPHRSTPGATEIFSVPRLEDRLARYRQVLSTAPCLTAHRRIPGVDSLLAELIERCLALDPAKRFPNVQAVLQALDHRQHRLQRRPLLVHGIVGPLLVVLVLAVGAVWGFNVVMGQAISGATRRAQEGNRLAAGAVAERFGLEIDRRFRILTQEAAHPKLRDWLLADRDDPKVRDQLHHWLQERHDYWNTQFPKKHQPTLWAVDDRQGLQRATSPPNPEFVNYPFGWRDYFHGQGKNLPRDGPLPPPIHRPHRSMVYRRLGQHEPWTVAFSVPVFDSQASEPIGVLIMTNDLGQFTSFQGTRNQFAVLIDLRPDQHGKRGLIVEHPVLEEGRLQQQKTFEPTFYSSAVAARMEALQPGTGSDFLGDYQDPVGPNRPAGWLAALEPVVLPTEEGQVQTGWVVLVQEDYESTLRPLDQLRWKLVAGGAITLLLVVLVITGVWAYVLVVLGEARGSRLVQRLRARLGLPSASSGSSPGSSASARSELERGKATPAPTAPAPGSPGVGG